MGNWALLVLGLAVLAGGLSLRRKSEGGYVLQLGHRAWSIFGNVTQTSGAISTKLPETPADIPTHRDWVGWTISGIGTIIAILQVLKIVG